MSQLLEYGKSDSNLTMSGRSTTKHSAVALNRKAAPLLFDASKIAAAHTYFAFAAFISALLIGCALHYKKIVKNGIAGYPEEWFPSVSATYVYWSSIQISSCSRLSIQYRRLVPRAQCLPDLHSNNERSPVLSRISAILDHPHVSFNLAALDLPCRYYTHTRVWRLGVHHVK